MLLKDFKEICCFCYVEIHLTVYFEDSKKDYFFLEYRDFCLNHLYNNHIIAGFSIDDCSGVCFLNIWLYA